MHLLTLLPSYPRTAVWAGEHLLRLFNPSWLLNDQCRLQGINQGGSEPAVAPRSYTRCSALASPCWCAVGKSSPRELLSTVTPYLSIGSGWLCVSFVSSNHAVRRSDPLRLASETGLTKSDCQEKELLILEYIALFFRSTRGPRVGRQQPTTPRQGSIEVQIRKS